MARGSIPWHSHGRGRARSGSRALASTPRVVAESRELVLDNEKKTSVSEGPHEKPPHAVLFEMLFGAWTAKILAEVVRLDVPDALAQGPMTADELVRKAGIRAHPVALASRAARVRGARHRHRGLRRPIRADAFVGAIDARHAGHAEAVRRILGRLAVEGLVRSARGARDAARRKRVRSSAWISSITLPRIRKALEEFGETAESAQRRREQGRDGALRFCGHPHARRRRRRLRAADRRGAREVPGDSRRRLRPAGGHRRRADAVARHERGRRAAA